jgi:DNA-binding NtrC family response regulator
MPSIADILVIDDDENMLEVFTDILEAAGFRVFAAQNGYEALKLSEEQDFPVTITDLRLPGIDGLELLREFKEKNHPSCVIVMTAYATVETALEAMKQGAYDYITKPFSDDEIVPMVRRALEYVSLTNEVKYLRGKMQSQCEVEARHAMSLLVGKSPQMRRIRELIEIVAEVDSTVLIQGETGTGKELVARAIHASSDRAEEPFIALSCASLPGSLLESELFGYERGAFTGAIRSKKGWLEVAHLGTLFLDEVGEISPETQVKLLRFLQERSFERIGGRSSVEIDVRVIAAANNDLEKAVQEGTFREDLYYRLNIIPIYLPPLRERKGDVPLLVAFFLEKFRHQAKREVEGISPEALALMSEYDWPGNVRELENVIENAVVLTRDSVIMPYTLPKAVRDSHHAGSESYSLRENEKRLILKALTATDWEIKRAAELLEISRPTLYSKMSKHGIKKGRQVSRMLPGANDECMSETLHAPWS